MDNHAQALSARTEFVIVVLVAFGYFMATSLLTLVLPRPRAQIDQAHLQFLIVYELIILCLLGWFLHRRGWNLQRLGLNPGVRETLVGAGIAVMAYLVYLGIWIVVASVAPETLRAAAATQARLVAPGLAMPTIVATSLLNPVYEELFVCGYVISVLKERRGFWFAVNTSVAIRLIYHLYQGAPAVIGVIPLGLIFAFWYAKSGRLWPVVVAHALFDFTALVAYGWR